MVPRADIDPLDLPYYTLRYDEAERWLEAQWRGFVKQEEARQGAEAYLRFTTPLRCPYLLNDNSRLQGPWFEGLDWLREIWMPAAVHLGLRYVAHVQQADRYHDVLLLSGACALPFELQIFRDPADAQQWLSQMRDETPARA